MIDYVQAIKNVTIKLEEEELAKLPKEEETLTMLIEWIESHDLYYTTIYH